jgi:hypothetical protein
MRIASATAGRICVLVILLAITGCDLRKTARSFDNRLQVKLPIGWTQTTLPNSKAKLSALDSFSGGYASVLTQPRADFTHADLKAYARSCMANSAAQSKLQNRVTDLPQNLTINGRPAIRYHMTDTLNGNNFEHIFTFYQSDSFFVQVTCWSAAANFNSNKDDFEAITSGVVELKP